jgi:ribonuclease PH
MFTLTRPHVGWIVVLVAVQRTTHRHRSCRKFARNFSQFGLHFVTPGHSDWATMRRLTRIGGIVTLNGTKLCGENRKERGNRVARADGRAADQLRPVKITPDFITQAEGSVLIETGGTRVIVTATVDDGVPSFLKGTGKGWVTGEYGMLPRATEERTPRESTKGRQSGRTLEIQRMIGRALRSVTDLKALGERTVWLDCDVIQADGGTRTASVTGAFVALALALERMKAAGMIQTVPLLDSLAATSVGIVNDRLLLDLAYEEDSRAQVDMNVVMTSAGNFVEVQATAEGRPYTTDELNALLELAAGGIRELQVKQQELLRTKFVTRR